MEEAGTRICHLILFDIQFCILSFWSFILIVCGKILTLTSQFLISTFYLKPSGIIHICGE